MPVPVSLRYDRVYLQGLSRQANRQQPPQPRQASSKPLPANLLGLKAHVKGRGWAICNASASSHSSQRIHREAYVCRTTLRQGVLSAGSESEDFIDPASGVLAFFALAHARPHASMPQMRRDEMNMESSFCMDEGHAYSSKGICGIR